MSKDKDKERRSSAKGDALILEAEKKLKSWSLFGGSSKYEDAVELYEQAAKQLKVDKNYEKSGKTFEDAADICLKTLKDVSRACTNYVEAAKCYKQVSLSDAVRVNQLAVSLYAENNRMSQAARIWKEIATLEEKQSHTAEALKAWSECANCHELEDATASANAAWLKVAELAAEQLDYKRSISIYEKVATASAESSLGRWSVKDYIFKASVLNFLVHAKADTMGSFEEQIKDYKDKFPTFDGSRECKLIEDCIGAFNEDDADKFTGFLRAYDKVVKLDVWTSKILLEIKMILKEGVDKGKEDTDEGTFV